MKNNYIKSLGMTIVIGSLLLPLQGVLAEDASVANYQSTLTNLISEPYAVTSSGERSTADFYYSLYDVDQNGTSELIIGYKSGDSFGPQAIYYLNGTVPTRLTYSLVSGPARQGFTLYTDGTIKEMSFSSGTGQGTTTLYQLAKDNSYAIVLEEKDLQIGDESTLIDVSGKTEIDLSTLDYKQVSEPIIVGEGNGSKSTSESNSDSANPSLPLSLSQAKIGDEIAFPKELAGIWTTVETPNGTRPGRPSSVIIGEDGTYTSTYSDGDLQGSMAKLRKVADNMFVIVDDTNHGIFGISGIGGNPGPNGKVEYGIKLDGTTLSNVEWYLTVGAEDYSSPNVWASFTNPSYKPVSENTTVTTTSESSETTTTKAISETQTKNKKSTKLFGILPMTGEQATWLGLGGLVIIDLVLGLKLKKK